jgi:hypothetical protein
MQQNGDLAQLAAETDLAKLQIQVPTSKKPKALTGCSGVATRYRLGVRSRAGVRLANRTVCKVYRKGLVWLYGRVSCHSTI